MKKRILFVINTMGRAGAERVMISLMRTLDPNVFDMDLLTIIPRGEMFLEVPEHVNILNKDYIPKSVMDKDAHKDHMKTILNVLLKKCYFVKYIPYAIRNLYHQIKRGRLQLDKLFWRALAENTPALEKEYDLAIGYTEGGATYYVADKVKAKKKAVFVHIDYTKAGYINVLDKRYYAKVDAIFSVSDVVRENFDKAYPQFIEKSKTFQNLVIPQDIYDAAKRGRGFEDDFDGMRILTVARLHPQKALDIAIPAFADVVKKGFDNVRWYVLGEGGERAALEKLIAQHNLQDKFILLGARANPYPFFDQCNIYIQASHFEGWSISIIEALILKKPTIISDFAGSFDQITPEETGIIIKLSEENLANAIIRLLEDQSLRDKFEHNLDKKKGNYAKDLKLLYQLLEMPFDNQGE